MRRPGILLAMAALAAQLGCLIWPFPTGELLSGRGRIRKEDTAPLQVGTATREDVLLRLGEPDEVTEGGKVFVYRWTEVRGYAFVSAGSGGAAIPFPGHRTLRLEFDSEALLSGVVCGQPEPRSAESGRATGSSD